MDPQELSAQELVQLCLDRNQEAAWDEFVRRFQPRIALAVKRTIRQRTTPTPDLVDDLVNDTFLKLIDNDLRALREFDFQHEIAFYGFLKTVASNVVIDYFRTRLNKKRGGGVEEVSLDNTADFVPDRRGGARQVYREITIHEIHDFLKSLNSEPNFVRDYSIFWLYYQHGLTAKAISRLPGIQLQVKGVESTLLRLTKLVRSRMTRAAER